MDSFFLCLSPLLLLIGGQPVIEKVASTKKAGLSEVLLPNSVSLFKCLFGCLAIVLHMKSISPSIM